jgi:hypothetical protein
MYTASFQLFFVFVKEKIGLGLTISGCSLLLLAVANFARCTATIYFCSSNSTHQPHLFLSVSFLWLILLPPSRNAPGPKHAHDKLHQKQTLNLNQHQKMRKKPAYRKYLVPGSCSRSLTLQIMETMVRIADLIELRRLRRTRRGIDVARLNKGDAKRRRKREREEEGGEDREQAGLRKGASLEEDE